MRLALIVMLCLAAPAAAQEAAAPTLTDAQALRLDLLQLRAENLALQQVLLQAETAAFVATLQREGYQLQRAGGTWRYVAVQP